MPWESLYHSREKKMDTPKTHIQDLSDHDLLIRIDERTRDLVDEIRGKDGLLRRVSRLERFMWGFLAIGGCAGWAASFLTR